MSSIMHPGLCILYAIGAWVVFFICFGLTDILMDKITRRYVRRPRLWCTFKIITAILVLFTVMSLCVWIFVPRNETIIDTQVDVDTKEITSVLKYTKVVNENGVTAITSNDGYVVISGDNYLCFYQTPEGIREQKVPAKPENTVIVYTDETPQLSITTTVTYYRHDWWFFYTDKTDQTKVKYELRIPEGSLTT